MNECRVYRVRTINDTVRYGRWGQEAPHPDSKTQRVDLTQIGNMIMINMTKHM